ncbi:9080_t:CDS:2 [Acaulospora colombiana]|uniref:9080_t:CDS:1 n=1 Tax=Acaulospora colombiana TaxID=27376 RepID=A0ACA9JXR2_9GLOM|nr:9080_t:CDS:2 [Acaulospora colombiana]
MSPPNAPPPPPQIQIEPEVIATNTLILTDLGREFFLPANHASLQNHLEQYGAIYKFVPIKSFNRILVVFFQTSDAKIAKAQIERHTPISDEFEGSRFLNVPEMERNLLISPPGSPPVGWNQVREESPNSVTLADDLIHALAHISIHNLDPELSDLEGFSLDNNPESDINISQRQIPILTVLPKEFEKISTGEREADVPLILIQDWDDTPSFNKNIKKPMQINSRIKAQFRPTPAPFSL